MFSLAGRTSLLLIYYAHLVRKSAPAIIYLIDYWLTIAYVSAKNKGQIVSKNTALYCYLFIYVFNLMSNKIMRKIKFIVLCLFLTVFIAKAQKAIENPLPIPFGDPYVLYDGDGKYYMYGTGGDVESGFGAYSSSNLQDWKLEGQVYYHNNENGWGIDSYWAPEVYKRDGKYYMFYSAQWKHNPNNEKENFKIGVAVSDKPTGPFIDLHNRPIFNPDYPIIDANVWFENGKTYLYYSR